MTAITLPGFLRSATAGGSLIAQAFAPGAGARLSGSTSGTVDIFAPATVTTPYTLTLPAELGASNKLLQVDSSGNLTLVDPVSPAGSNTEIQYRNGSAFGAVAGSSWDGTTLTLPNVSFSGTLRPSATGIYFDDTTSRRLFLLGGVLKSTTHIEALSLRSDAIRPAGQGASINLGLSSGHYLYISDSGTFFGNGIISATPASGYLYGTGGSGTNVVGGTLYLGPGPSTGNATPSAVVIQSTVAGTSGSTSQTLFSLVTFSGLTITLADAANFVLNATTGTKIGTATTQKLGLWNATPIVQPTTGYAEATFAENAGGTAVNDDSTFDGYTLRQVVAALRGFGLLA